MVENPISATECPKKVDGKEFPIILTAPTGYGYADDGILILL